MGHGIAQTLALAGFPVNLTDVRSEVMESALENVKDNLTMLAEHGVVTRAQCRRALRNLRLVDGASEAVGDADFIIETISEDLELKKRLYRTIEGACGRGAILATNTSTIEISDLARALDSRGRFVGMHWWNPPYLMPLIEVVVGPETSPKTVESTVALTRQLGKVPLVCKNGVLGPRLQGALMIEALRMLEEGAASAEDIDAVTRLTLGLRLPIMGPLQTIDRGGALTVLRAFEYLPERPGDRYAVPKLLRDNVERGWLGVHAGRGFYTYTEEQRRELLKRRDEYLIQRMKEANQAKENGTRLPRRS